MYRFETWWQQLINISVEYKIINSFGEFYFYNKDVEMAKMPKMYCIELLIYKVYQNSIQIIFPVIYDLNTQTVSVPYYCLKIAWFFYILKIVYFHETSYAFFIYFSQVLFFQTGRVLWFSPCYYFHSYFLFRFVTLDLVPLLFRRLYLQK